LSATSQLPKQRPETEFVKDEYFVYNVENSDNSDHIEKFTHDDFGPELLALDFFFLIARFSALIIFDSSSELLAIGFASYYRAVSHPPSDMEDLTQALWAIDNTKIDYARDLVIACIERLKHRNKLIKIADTSGASDFNFFTCDFMNCVVP
jgi:hypothetical protein